MGLRRDAHRHQAGTDAEVFTTYAVGQPVMTIDGLPGVIVSVSQGPYQQTERYEVVLDDGLGGGTYDTRELQPLADVVSTASVVERVTADYVPVTVDDPNLHVASEDYPELAEILVERPPLAHTEPLSMHAAKTASPDRGSDDDEDEDDDYPTQGRHHDDPGEDDSGDDDNLFDERYAHRTAAGEFAAVLPPTMPIAIDPVGTAPGLDESSEEFEALSDGEPVGIIHTDDDPAIFEASVHEAGMVWDHVVAPVVDAATGYLDAKNPDAANGGSWSYDWCRFRRDRHCWYPKSLNLAASQQVGYSVWNPEDRGICWRDNWDDQKKCSISAPGPHSGDPAALTDATVPWEMGGQRNGVVVAAGLGERMQIEAAFEFAASWADVRAKAAAIRQTGGVHVISITGDKETGRTVTAEVRGEHGVYETQIASEPGRANAAMWSCGCPWATYSWGRSGRWKKYEGRMCAHALALTYEAQSKNLMEQPDVPDWAKGEVIRPGEVPVKAAALRPVLTDAWLAPAVATRIAADMLSEGHEVESVQAYLGEKIVAQAIVMDFHDRLIGKVRGVVKTIRSIVTETGMVTFTDGSTAAVSDVVHPTYDPYAGLAHTGSLEMALDDALDVPGVEATYDPEPQAALPETTGDDEDPEQQHTDVLDNMPDEDAPAPRATAALDEGSRAWLMSEGSAPTGGGRGSFSDADIAAAATEALTKMAVKTFSIAEQQEIIDEGEDVRAANLAALDIAGTHYEGLADEDEPW